MRTSTYSEQQIIGFLNRATAGEPVAVVPQGGLQPAHLLQVACQVRRPADKCLAVADDFSHECVQMAMDFGIGGQYGTRLLDEAAQFRGYPKGVRTDNGPDFTSRAFLGWCERNETQHVLIEPGRTMPNGYIESFNGKFRNECLNEHWFETLAQAHELIRVWAQDYNEVRPHSSIGRMPQGNSRACIASKPGMQVHLKP